MESFGKFIGGLVVGAAVGAAVAFIATPKTGDETRISLSNYWNSALDRGKQAAKDREAELWAEFNTRVKEQDGTMLQVEARG